MGSNLGKVEIRRKRIIEVLSKNPIISLTDLADTLLEMCPVCNLQTGAAASWQTYPAKLFAENGIATCFNTDNRTVSHTTLTQEYTQIDRHCYPLTEQLIMQQTANTIPYLFADATTKTELQTALDRFKG